MTARYLTLTIPPELAGAEVNTLLRRHLHLSGTVLRRIKWLDDGITLNGERVTVRARVSAGQTLAVRLTCPARTSGVVPAPGPLDIVYEDGDIAVVSKAPGVLVHPGHGHYADTVGNFLLHRWQSRGEESDFHPVHRLDKGTSGLLVVAKHPHGQELLKRQLHTGRFVRRYLAVCDGCPHPPEGVVDAPLRLRPGSLMEQEIHPEGKGALTRYRVVETTGPRSLVELELDTGRTHQIRVHMAHLGCPLTGDFLYGREDRARIGRPALHSARAEFDHPITGARLSFTLPLPEDMRLLFKKER